jgi:hypothetical protein
MIENIIALQSRLSQAPDDFLSKEITKPSGRIPVSLIYGEIQRRKEMRMPAMAKSKGNIMGLQEGGIVGLQTLPAYPEARPQTLANMPEPDPFSGYTLEELEDEYKRTPDDHPLKGRIQREIFLRTNPGINAVSEGEAVDPGIDEMSGFPSPDGSNETKGKPFDPSWVGKTSPEAAEATRAAHAEINKGKPDHYGNIPSELQKLIEGPAAGGGSPGIGGLAQSQGSDSFFKALEDEMGKFGDYQKDYKNEMGKNREAYQNALKNDPYAALIEQQKAENGKDQKWGIPLMALASGILGGKNLAQGLSQGLANTGPVLERQDAKQTEKERYLQQLMLGQGQMQRGDAKDVFGMNSDAAKSNYSMYGDRMNMMGKAAELGLKREENEIRRGEAAARAAYLASGGGKNPLSGYVGILKLDTTQMEPEQAARINKLQATILTKIFGIDDEEEALGPDEFGVGITE